VHYESDRNAATMDLPVQCSVKKVHSQFMKIFTAIVERDSDTNLYVGYVPGLSGAHSQGETLDELQENLREVIEMLLEDEEVVFKMEFVGTQQIVVQ
jgi:predicted RNase H-like HicB family nuclease